MPYPSNRIRHCVVILCEKLSSNAKARTTQQVLLVITALLFVESLRALYYSSDDEHKHESILGHTEHEKRFRNQRNAFISGFILYMALVIFRLQSITVQMYKMRQEQKEKEAAVKAAAKDPAAKKGD